MSTERQGAMHWPDGVTRDGKPRKTPANCAAAIAALGIRPRLNLWTGRIELHRVVDAKPKEEGR
jgi:hypothetical protein